LPHRPPEAFQRRRENEDLSEVVVVGFLTFRHVTGEDNLARESDSGDVSLQRAEQRPTARDQQASVGADTTHLVERRHQTVQVLAALESAEEQHHRLIVQAKPGEQLAARRTWTELSLDAIGDDRDVIDASVQLVLQLASRELTDRDDMIASFNRRLV